MTMRRLLTVLLIVIGHAFIPEVVNDTRVNLFVCTLRSPINLYQFNHDKNFLLEVDKNRCNVAGEQRNRSVTTKLGDYECATIKNLQERDTGVYDLYITKEDGIFNLRKTFLLTTDVLNDLRNASHFNTNGSNHFQHLLIHIYLSTSETELPEALRLSLCNGTKPDDFILALLVISQNPATVTVTPPPATNKSLLSSSPAFESNIKGTALPPKDGYGVILTAVFVVFGIAAIIAFIMWNRNRCAGRPDNRPANPAVPENEQMLSF